METREEHYASMMQAITRYAPSADLEVIQRAYEYADEKHKNQLRKSGEPYIIHPLAVAEIVAEQNGNIIRLEHNQFVNINRQSGVELRVTLEAFGHVHKQEIIKAVKDGGYDVREVMTTSV